MVFSQTNTLSVLQIIVVLGLVVIVAGLMGTGFLGEPVTKINLWVQALGWGEGDLESPITTGTVDLLLDSIPNENPDLPPVTIVAACDFHSDETIDAGTGKSDGMLVCKLLNENENAIAEGSVSFSQYSASTHVIIPINQPIVIGATNFDGIFDAMVLVKGPL